MSALDPGLSGPWAFGALGFRGPGLSGPWALGFRGLWNLAAQALGTWAFMGPGLSGPVLSRALGFRALGFTSGLYHFLPQAL